MNKKLFWIFALSSAVYFTQGIEGLPSQGLFYYLKETLNFSPEKIMLISSLTISAWLVKPVIGYIIDNFLHKKAWIFLALLFDIILVVFVGLMQLPLVILISILILNSNNAAFRDVAVDGIMCVEGKKYSATGKIQSVQWISISVAGLLTGIGGGIIAEKWGYQAAFLALIPIYLLVGIPAYFYKEDETLNPKPRSTLFSDLKKLFAHKQLLIVGLFIFLYKYSPSFGTPLFFIQRDSFKWGKIWIGTLGTISTTFGIVGSLIYYKVSTKINIKKWLYISVFLGAVTTLSYLYYTPATAVVYEVVYSLIGMFIFLMVMDFMARKTIKGLEATSFAFLCSISNLALVTSNLSGAFLLPKVGLQWLIVLSALTSFLCLPLINKINEPTTYAT
jgi:predicted MFS family arabinose efflux permease